MIYASGSKFFRFGPATRPTRPKRTKEPIPKPAAQGLKPPKAKEANGGGAQIKVQRTNPMQGVSGVMTLMSTLASICRISKANKSSLFIC